jgi:hypothetical protein
MNNNEKCVYKSPKVLTPSQAKKMKVGTFYHPTENTIRTGACPEGFELRNGKELKKYIPKHKKMNENHSKILTEKQAAKKPIGSFYHPTEHTYRSGACPEGYNLKKGYKREAYNKKDGTHVQETYVDPICVKNKGLPGKLMSHYKPIHLNKKGSLEPFGYSTSLSADKRFECLLNAMKILSYRTVILRINALHTLTKKSDSKHAEIYKEDFNRLRQWRKENPDLYKNKNNHVSGNVSTNVSGNVSTNVSK